MKFSRKMMIFLCSILFLVSMKAFASFADCKEESFPLFLQSLSNICASSPAEAKNKVEEVLTRQNCFNANGVNKCVLNGQTACASKSGCVFGGAVLNTNAIFQNTNVKCNGGDFYNIQFNQNDTFTCECTCCGRGDGAVSLEKDQCSSSDDPSCGCDGGNLVKLSSFTAAPTDKGISLNWNTETELDSQGFRIWRAIPDLSRYCGCSGNIEDYTQIQVLDEEGKPVLIPARGTTTSGSDYSYLDKNAKPGIAYCYALEDVDSRGESKFYFEYVAFTPDGLSEKAK